MDLRAVIFVPALAAAAICVFAFLTFAAHYYLTILESTAAGAKEVTWVQEQIIDKFWKPFYLAWLVCLWLGPAYIIGRMLAGRTGVEWLKLAVPVLVAWLLYPVSQLSSLSASSVWIPLHPQVPARFAQKPAVTLGFFLLTLPVFALAGIAFKWAFLTKAAWELLLVGMPLLVLAGFLYARLLGRLAFALMFTRDLLRRRKKKKSKKSRDVLEEAAAKRDAEAESEPTYTQPSEVTISTPDGEVAGYNVLIGDDQPAPKKRVKAEVVEDEPPPAPAPQPQKSARRADAARDWTDDDDDASPYDAHPAEVSPEERIPESVTKPNAEELALLERSDVPKPPKVVWNAQLFAFLTQPGTVSAILLLTFFGLLAGAAVRVARMFDPTT